TPTLSNRRNAHGRSLGKPALDRAALSPESAAGKGRGPAHQTTRYPARSRARLHAGRRLGVRSDRRRSGGGRIPHRAAEPGGGGLERHGGTRTRQYRPARRQAGDGGQGGPVQEV